MTASDPSRKPTAWQRICRTLFLGVLDDLAGGRLVLVEPSCASRVFGAVSGPTATVEVRDPAFYPAVVLEGSVGAGKAWMEGWWTCDDLTAAVRIFARSGGALRRWRRGPARFLAPLGRGLLWLRRNTRRGSRRNIAAHYDLGNDFFARWLDTEHRMYSCAVFPREGATLEEASTAKLARIAAKLDLQTGDRVLEIGTGWGGFALYAARTHGCHVTTVTISEEQYRHTAERVRAENLQSRVDVRLQDYRDVEGTFDKLVSIEMIEAVGPEYLETFVRRCGELLSAQGRMLLQAIVIDDREYERAARSVDFIKRYIFPGSFMPSVHAILGAARRATDLRLSHLEDITPHYARTLAEWRRRFLSRWEEIAPLGFDERFRRMWEFYLCYCEGGFLERRIGDVQMLLDKPGCRRPAPLPGLAGDLETA